MESYVEEFRDDREKDSDLVVTVDGVSGAGKGTLAEHIADELDLPCYSAGDFFRSIAADRGMTVEELSEKAGKEVDVEVDRRTLEKGLEESCVIEGRLPSWILGSYSDLRIRLEADLEERARRVMYDYEGEGREAEEEVSDLEALKQKMRKRDEDNARRYEDYYGIDLSDLEIYDLIVDNTDLGVDDQNRLVGKVLEKKFPERYG
ncbi:MAG: (d)CMP kinase [Candidatus Nanohaloarchaea archaeon]